jgi:DNA-binding response OmpR family regulator
MENSYKREILVICKNKTHLWFVLNYLGKQGFLVDGAEDYISALEKINQGDHDLVIFYDKMEEKEMDYIINISSEMAPQIRFLQFDGPMHQLPEQISRMDS